MDSLINIKRNLNGFEITQTSIKYKSFYNFKKFYNNKLNNSISRAKNVVFDLVRNNYFPFFVTFTLNVEHENFELSTFRKNFNERLKYMKKKGFNHLSYILIPEKTKRGIWHFHGFLSDGFGADMYVNDNGFLSLSSFDSLGFTSISKVKNYNACCKYILKYINKDMVLVLKGQHLYFCSRGLKRSESILKFYGSSMQPLNFDYYSNYVNKKTLNEKELKKYIDFMYENNKIYLVISDRENLVVDQTP